MKLFREIDDKKAVEILSCAFHDDPIMRWVSKDHTFLPTLFSLLVPCYRRQGVALMGEEENGVALWMPPGKSIKIKFSSLKLIFKLWKILGIASIYKIDRLFFSLRKYEPKEPYYYLYAIGVLQNSKGKGVGASLLAPMLARCDKENKIAYLENTRIENLLFYKNHGFKVIKEVEFGKNAPKVWLMVRNPLTRT